MLRIWWEWQQFVFIIHSPWVIGDRLPGGYPKDVRAVSRKGTYLVTGLNGLANARMDWTNAFPPNGLINRKEHYLKYIS